MRLVRLVTDRHSGRTLGLYRVNAHCPKHWSERPGTPRIECIQYRLVVNYTFFLR